jgi:hypothetical protein
MIVTHLNRNIVRILVVSMCFLGLPVRVAQGEMVPTDRIDFVGQTRPAARERLAALFDRTDVRVALERHGVSADEARARVGALSEEEIESLAARFDSLPAAGNGFESVLWIGFLVFVILLVTDILGFTKVFPFTRSAK